MTTPIPILRTSERKDFKRCPQKWWWAWREGYKSRGTALDALWFGTGVHLALAAWYKGPDLKRGRLPVETWMAYCEDALAFVKTSDTTDEEAAKYTSAQELGRVMMEGYIEKYGRDDHKLIIAPEQTFRLEVPWPAEQSLYEVAAGSTLVICAGTFDNTWRHAGSGFIFLDEHKTAKTVGTQHLSLDDQGGTYWAMAERTLKAAGLIKKSDRVRGIEYNFLRKGLPDDRPRDEQGYATNKPIRADYIAALSGIAGEFHEPNPNCSLVQLKQMAADAGVTVVGERSKIQTQPLFVRHMVPRTSKERITQLRRIQDEALVIQTVRDGLLPVTLTPTRDCRWDCDFFSMCELKEGSGNWKEFARLQYRRQDPYADHRKSAED